MPTDPDRIRAHEKDILIFQEEDLAYYENLTSHLGPAARYQLLADMLPGRTIPGLKIRVPAVRSKMAGTNCYIFSMRPEDLLKIAYISHRSKGRASDVDAYQRMVSKARLRRIAQYISDDGVFPTNIVVNLDVGKRGNSVRFERSKQEEDSGWSTLGWLTIRPSYKSAWIIDGQHRLFAYSGHPRASKSLVAVLAFEGLEGSEQMKLFTDINAKQKSVKQSLLQELYADLHMFSDDPEKRVQAVVSRTIQGLGAERDSPIYDRIRLADSIRTPTRCITLASMFSALAKTGFYYGQIRTGIIVDPGPLWHQDNETAIKRSIVILKGWLNGVAQSVPDWWELGSAPGGGLAMNEGITICVNVLRSVFDYFADRRTKLVDLTPDEVLDRLLPFSTGLGAYFAGFSEKQRIEFRALRGVQGQTTGTRHAQEFLRSKIPDFEPHGLQEFLDREKAKTNDQAAAVILEIERLLHTHVLDEVKGAFPSSDNDWWYEGVPESVRRPVVQRMEEDKGRAGSREAYFDLIHYREVILANWQLLGPLFGYGKSGNKQTKTSWLVHVNEIRKLAMHGSRGATVTYEQLNTLREYLAWLRQQILGEVDPGIEPNEDEAELPE